MFKNNSIRLSMLVYYGFKTFKFVYDVTMSIRISYLRLLWRELTHIMYEIAKFDSLVSYDKQRPLAFVIAT